MIWRPHCPSKHRSFPWIGECCGSGSTRRIHGWCIAYRGSQYCSQEFADLTAELHIRRSVGRTGVCYDNAWAESFNGTLKVERVNRTSYPTREHARIDITRYIELRYNQLRLHSSLGYITPNEAEQIWFEQMSAA